MQGPLTVTFRDMPHSPELEDVVRAHALKLDQFFDGIIRCDVVIQAPHKHHRRGNLYSVRVHLSVPRRELVVDREQDDEHAHEDVRVAIRDAFDRMRRQLEDYARELRGDVKHHVPAATGVIARLLKDYGFISTSDGGELYFHRNSVVEAEFEALRPGEEVSFVETMDADGPRATSVRAGGRHSHSTA